MVLTTGTFLGGRIHIGREQRPAGRLIRQSETAEGIDAQKAEPPSNDMTRSIKVLGFPVDRLRTGTPARIKLSSINLSELPFEESENPVQPFSFMHQFNGFEPVNE